jgi:DNA-binding transcriptional regulator YiaG
MSAIIDTPTPAPQKQPDATVELSTIEKLLIIRRRLGLSVKQAAKRWRLNSRSLNAWEQSIGGGGGGRRPRPHNERRLRKIAFDEEEKMRAAEEAAAREVEP